MTTLTEDEKHAMITARILAIQEVMEFVEYQEGPGGKDDDRRMAAIHGAIAYAAVAAIGATHAPVGEGELMDVADRMREAAIEAMVRELKAVQERN